MKITKYGHCCLLVEENGVRVLTDPGSYTTAQNEVKGIDIILITHEHGDHFHVESVKKILKNNPEALIVTNSAVDRLLKEAGIDGAIMIEEGEAKEVKGIMLSGHGKDHAEIYKDRNLVLNTGYFIGDRFYYPGDAFHNPGKKVEILALPVAGPWCKIRHSIDFYLELMPKIMFPVHDAQLNDFGLGSIRNGQTAIVAKENGINFLELEIGKETEIE